MKSYLTVVLTIIGLNLFSDILLAKPGSPDSADLPFSILYKNDRLQSLAPLTQVLDDSDIFLVGNIHSPAWSEPQVTLIKQLKSLLSEIDCIFVEMPVDFQPTIDALSSNPNDPHFSETLEIWLGKRPTTSPEDLASLRDIVDRYRREFGFYLELGIEIKAINVATDSVIQKTIDRIPVFTQIPDDANMRANFQYEKRNQFMASEAARYFQNGKCNKAIFPVGKAHIFPVDFLRHKNIVTEPIQIKLSKADLKPFVFNLGGCDRTDTFEIMPHIRCIQPYADVNLLIKSTK